MRPGVGLVGDVIVKGKRGGGGSELVLTNAQRYDGYDHHAWEICGAGICTEWWPDYHSDQRDNMDYMRWDSQSARTPWTIEGAMMMQNTRF